MGKLVTESSNIEKPAAVTPESMPNAGGSGVGSESGKNQLVNQSTMDREAGNLAGGAMQPSVWGKEGTAFSVSKMPNPGTTVSSKFQTVDLNTGQIVPNVENERL